jgi:uncharacterized protein YodC (DUF2158 family)
MSQFKIGDQVALKSGGPRMTIESIGDAGLIYCVWFSGNDVRRQNFHPDALESWEEAERALTALA